MAFIALSFINLHKLGMWTVGAINRLNDRQVIASRVVLLGLTLQRKFF